jgi:hypothetical protein
MSKDIILDVTPDGQMYSLGATTESPLDRTRGRFTTQFLSTRNEVTGRGSVFMDNLLQGSVRTNADILTLVATATAQIRSLERELSRDVTLQSVDLLSIEFIDNNAIKVGVRLNSTEGSTTSDIVVNT